MSVQSVSKRPASARVLINNRDLKATLDQVRLDKGQNVDPFENQATRAIWRGFCLYITKQLIKGKAIIVPKFGLFTFSATEVQLLGTTNPLERDKQLREPIFIIGKDFCSGVERKQNNFLSDQDLKSGICVGDAIRPLELKGVNGVIPKVKINYFEVGQLCGHEKEACKEQCEIIFKSLSDRVRKAEQLTVDLPMVGRFLVRTRVAAINFNSELIERTRGVTAKQFTVGNLFGSLDATHSLTTNLIEKNRRRSMTTGGAQRVTNEAANWLQTKFGIDIDSLPQNEYIQSPFVHSQKDVRANLVTPLKNDHLSANALSRLDSANSRRGPGSRASSRPTTAMSSHMSQLPPAEIYQLKATAAQIVNNRQAIAEKVMETVNVTLRDVIPSSKMLSIFRQVNLNIDIISLKQLLRALGFPYNGPSTSLTSLLAATKLLMQNGTANLSSVSVKESDMLSEFSKVINQDNKETPDNSIDLIRDIIFTSQQSLFNLFRKGVDQSGKYIDKDGFLHIMEQVSGGSYPPDNALTVFNSLAKRGKMTFEQFEQNFKSQVPNTLEMDTKVIRKVREWMFVNKMSAEMAFDSFCRIVGRHTDKKLDRESLHRAMKTQEIGLTAAEIDSLYDLLLKESSKDILDVDLWLSRIYEDGDNPLQMIREIVLQHNLTQDDLIYQMKLKLWDDPLTHQQLQKAIRNLDESISDSQIKALFLCLKDKNKVIPVPVLIQNLTGKTFETVEFRQKMLSILYETIYPDKESQLLNFFQELDQENNGMLKPKDILCALQKTATSISFQDLERFVRLLETNKQGKLNYTEFLAKITASAKKTHNPFRNLVNRIAYFLKHNSISIEALLKRILEGQSEPTITINRFADFLKVKVDKKNDIETLKQLVAMIDIDKDNTITEHDVSTCIKNLNNLAFWRARTAHKSIPLPVVSLKPSLNSVKASEIIDQIHNAMKKRQISFQALFDLFDIDKDNMVSLAEFQRGLNELITISVPVVEQLYSLIDKTNIGLINYNQFLEVLQARKYQVNNVKDNFDWEESIVEKLKKWISNENLNVEEAFKQFDKDFDGFVSKDDLRQSLLGVLRVPKYEITDNKIQRLYKLLDTFSTGHIQLADFQRLAASSKQNDSNKISADWKQSAIQQCGILMQKKFGSIMEGFEKCSSGAGKVNFESFKQFFTQQNMLVGFILTSVLLQELFSKLDPHKKGYISSNDWKNAFGSYNLQNFQLQELKTLICGSFSNYDSAFSFLLSFSQNSIVDYKTFEKAIIQFSNERFNSEQAVELWKIVNQEDKLDKYAFRKHFGSLNYSGCQTVTSSASSRSRSCIVKTATSQHSKWETNIVEKIKGLLKVSTRSMLEIFQEFNPDGNGQITQVEFRNAIRKLNLGISSKEIDKLMVMIDANKDGLIDYNEFLAKFSVTKHEDFMSLRIKDKLAKLKELMILHMHSVIDAFRYFDVDKAGTLNFSDFNRLVTKCYEIGNLKPPAYPVIKDLFDSIDIRKDGEIDFKEWSQTFGLVTEGNNSLTIKPTPLAQWENSNEFLKIGEVIARSRKVIIDCFKKVLGNEQTLYTFKQGKQALDDWIYKSIKGGLTDPQLKCIFHVAQAHTDSQHVIHYDYMRFVDVYRARHAGPQM